MHNTFAETIKDMRGLINEWSAPSADTSAPGILLAVSGGIDSMCMASLFSGLEDRLPFALAHCNFRLRGEESDGDEALVRSWAEENGCPLHTVSFDTQTYAHEKGISIEMAARDLRYSWFASLCREYGYSAVAVAHNANDNAETMVLNILRGAGIRGLQGMSAISSLPCPDADGILLLRPLLGCTRKQIEGYALAHEVAYREDSTNASSDYKRNRIRNEVFPIFAGMNPSFIRTLNREMMYFSEAAEIVDDYCASELKGIVTEENGALRISVPELRGRKHWKYLLYQALEPFGFNSAVLASVEDLLASGRTLSGKCFESPDYELFTEREYLLVVKKTSVEAVPELLVEGEGIYRYGDRRFEVSLQEWKTGMPLKQPVGTIMLDAAKLRFPIKVRNWRKGDWMVPFGMKGRKKLSDLFADLKYGHKEKDEAMVLVDTFDAGRDGHRVAAVLGVRMDDRYKVGPGTGHVMIISII